MSAAPRKIASGPPSDRPITTLQFVFVYLRIRRFPPLCMCYVRIYARGKVVKWGPQFDLYGPIRAPDSRLYASQQSIAFVKDRREIKKRGGKRSKRELDRIVSSPVLPDWVQLYLVRFGVGQ